MRIVYQMKGVLYHLRYHFSWSRGYDAYALDKRDELQRCAFLMAHLLFERVGGLVRKPPSPYEVLIVTAGFDRHGSAGVEQVESWRTAGTFWVNPACLPGWMSHRLRMNIAWWCAQGGKWLVRMVAPHRQALSPTLQPAPSLSSKTVNARLFFWHVKIIIKKKNLPLQLHCKKSFLKLSTFNLTITFKK